MKVLKWILRIGVFLILFLPFLVLFLVRFTDLSVKGQGSICLVCYNEETGDWTFNGWEEYQLDGNDGPYVFRNQNSLEVLSVLERNGKYVINSHIQKADSGLILQSFPVNPDLKPISFQLQNRPFLADSITYHVDSKIMAISDIEGNFDAFYGFLKSNGVIDSDYNWTFGDGRLVLNGDFVDRGAEVTQVLWLIYHLETEARKAGGAVHFVLGNHEAMNLQKNVRYWNHKYRALLQHLSDSLNYRDQVGELIKPENEIVQWLKSKNVLLKIGKRLFVHAGISPEILEFDLSLSEINEIAKANIDANLYGQEEGDKNALLIMGRQGPLWYRGLKKDYKDYYKKASAETVNAICEKYGVDQIVIGHSVVDDITTDYKGKVLRIDVRHGKKLHSEKTLGVLIENGKLTKVNGKGEHFIVGEAKEES